MARHESDGAMVFDLEPIEIPVTIGGVEYVLCEASADAARKFNNKRAEAGRFSDGKLSGVSGLGDLEPLLVSSCLFRVTSRQVDGGVKRALSPVAYNTVLTWPARVVTPLFERAKKISELEETETLEALREQLKDTQEKIAELEAGENPAKNELAASTIGSD